jgi:hypothetical protein
LGCDEASPDFLVASMACTYQCIYNLKSMQQIQMYQLPNT